jgi:hypothetical protein
LVEVIHQARCSVVALQEIATGADTALLCRLLDERHREDYCESGRQERAANACTKTFAKDTGLTKDGQADERTKLTKHFGVPEDEMRAALTGKKKDGTPDMRTKHGKEARALKQTNIPVVEHSSKSDDSLSAQSTPQKKPPAHTPPSPAPEAAAKLVEKDELGVGWCSTGIIGEHPMIYQRALLASFLECREDWLKIECALFRHDINLFSSIFESANELG